MESTLHAFDPIFRVLYKAEGVCAKIQFEKRRYAANIHRRRSSSVDEIDVRAAIGVESFALP